MPHSFFGSDPGGAPEKTDRGQGKKGLGSCSLFVNGKGIEYRQFLQRVGRGLNNGFMKVKYIHACHIPAGLVNVRLSTTQ